MICVADVCAGVIVPHIQSEEVGKGKNSSAPSGFPVPKPFPTLLGVLRSDLLAWWFREIVTGFAPRLVVPTELSARIRNLSSRLNDSLIGFTDEQYESTGHIP